MFEKLWEFIWSASLTAAERDELFNALDARFHATALGWAPASQKLKVALQHPATEARAVLREITHHAV